jgi:hypothetical protein
MRSFAVAWNDLEFVQAVLAQLPSIEQIERELQGVSLGVCDKRHGKKIHILPLYAQYDTINYNYT